MGANFGFDDGLHGVFVVVEQEPLSPGCLTEKDIDVNIDRLKDELERVRAQMKVALASRTSILSDT